MLITDLDYFKRSANYTSKTRGIDDPNKSPHCTNKDWHEYPVQDFDYEFNSWGFRGLDYEQYIGKPVNICLGDSFTVNIGGPIEHSWTSQLALQFDIPTLNLGMDGAGNDAIKLVYDRACALFKVKDTFVMYSFLHRRLHLDEFIQVADEFVDNKEYFLKHRITNAYETALPLYGFSNIEKALLKHCKIFTIDTKQRNRDGFHMNEETNKIYADYFYNHWKQRNES